MVRSSQQTRLFAFKAAFLLMPQVCRWLLSGKVKDMSGWYVSILHLASVVWVRGFDACLPVCPVRLFQSTHTLLITFQMGVWGVNITVQIDDTIAALWLSKCFHPPPFPDCELCLNFLADPRRYLCCISAHLHWWFRSINHKCHAFRDSVCIGWLNV